MAEPSPGNSWKIHNFTYISAGKCIWKESHCFSELLVNMPAAALKATANAESKTGTKKQHFCKSLCADRLSSWEKHNSYHFSLYYAAKFHHCSDMSVTSHVLCVVMQVTLWCVPSLSSREVLVPGAETPVRTSGAWHISSLACSSLFNLSCIESTINQKTTVCVYVLEIWPLGCWSHISYQTQSLAKSKWKTRK